eukprot:jgi/Psemu1/47222/gm1.47222_g
MDRYKRKKNARTNQDHPGRFTVMIFALSILSVALFVRDGGGRGLIPSSGLTQDYLPAISSSGSGSSGTTSTSSTSSSSSDVPPALVTAAASRVERMAMYKDRYNYQIPDSYEEHSSRDELCGTGPDFDTYFKRSLKERSANNEDRTIYELFFKKKATEAEANAAETHQSPPHGSKGNIVELGAFNGINEAN